MGIISIFHERFERSCYILLMNDLNVLKELSMTTASPHIDEARMDAVEARYQIDEAKVERCFESLLRAIGEDPEHIVNSVHRHQLPDT